VRSGTAVGDVRRFKPHLHVHVRVLVASKNVTITEDAYDRLKALKRDDESFSELITRLTERTDPMDFAGTCPSLGEHVVEAGDELAEDLEERHDELFG
jgi:predicted CopG family antitoxin